MGNTPLFCTVWGLPEKDVSRLRRIWKKGSGEEQLDLTAALLGLPLCFDAELLPDTLCERDSAYVDRWIRERPDPPRIKNQAKAELIQELPNFGFKITGWYRTPFMSVWTLGTIHTPMIDITYGGFVRTEQWARCGRQM